jgi:hypothetical protein
MKLLPEEWAGTIILTIGMAVLILYMFGHLGF